MVNCCLFLRKHCTHSVWMYEISLILSTIVLMKTDTMEFVHPIITIYGVCVCEIESNRLSDKSQKSKTKCDQNI